MEPTLVVAVFASLFTAIFLPMMVSENDWKASQESDRARRLAEHKMKARLLRLNL
jgi:hypothetical protein